MKNKYRILLIVALLCAASAKAQDPPSSQAAKDSLSQQMDAIDVLKKIFPPKKTDTVKKASALAILPAIGYNPSTGFLLGINFLKSFHTDPSAKLSVAQLDGSYTSKNLIIVRFRTNIFTKDNKWNFQGNWQYLRNYVNDYGIGGDARRDPPVNYPTRFNYFRLMEKAYRNLGNNFYAGGGISFDLRNHINAEPADSTLYSPNNAYSFEKGFNSERYFVNGLILNFQYNTREHPNRSFGGIYTDLVFRYNTKLLGSSKESGQLYTELRKYISLSKTNPEHVLAFWYWGSYILWGEMPYLELPYTEYDTYNRSGRGYTLGRFRGPSFADAEVEYRFPISKRTKFLSGVLFSNFQTVSDGNNNQFLKYIEPAAGAGLRVLFNKKSRTNICLDYARGKYGSSGFFFSLNEAF
ncbi:BamA/TamA family outer membrane protein [Pedobacter sp. HMF7647]|uniref:BamA/TamA family outer membrane protein n=1 Tax=Hufsiella arboris TaxID=2695275 RepID=A0A7K1YF49_9SPHI|nr:BamA/TamA family outer membrane protein [Hufsiella arboris]MXV53234.1 BamA/TamA family outer membrane protein [Hufsiella arboris]